MTRWLVFALLCLPWQAFAQESLSSPPSPSRPGAIDHNGSVIVDPTENVKALNEAASKRQDDLRIITERLVQAKLDAIAEVNKLLYNHAQEMSRAFADKLESEARVRADYDEKLRAAEAKRIDAIRLVDVNAVSEDRRRTGEQAVALATQVSQSADTVRALVASTKTSTDLSVSQVTQALSQRITTLEQAGYQQAGKQTFQDPQIQALVTEVRNLSASRNDLAGVNAGRGDVIGWIVAGVSLLILLGGLVLNYTRHQPARRRS